MKKGQIAENVKKIDEIDEIEIESKKKKKQENTNMIVLAKSTRFCSRWMITNNW